MGHLYVLKLRGGKWYVGYTDRSTAERILEHIEKKGSQWTKLHPPLKKGYLHNFTTPGKTREDEDKRTLYLMKQHGMENVRGGRWSFPEFYPSTIKELKGLIGRPKRKAKRNPRRRCNGFSSKRRRCGVKGRNIPKLGFCKHHWYQAPWGHSQYQGDPHAYEPGMHREGTLTKDQLRLLTGHVYGGGHEGENMDWLMVEFSNKSPQWRKRWLVDEPKRVPKPSGRIVTR